MNIRNEKNYYNYFNTIFKNYNDYKNWVLIAPEGSKETIRKIYFEKNKYIVIRHENFITAFDFELEQIGLVLKLIWAFYDSTLYMKPDLIINNNKIKLCDDIDGWEIAYVIINNIKEIKNKNDFYLKWENEEIYNYIKHIDLYFASPYYDDEYLRSFNVTNNK